MATRPVCAGEGRDAAVQHVYQMFSQVSAYRDTPSAHRDLRRQVIGGVMRLPRRGAILGPMRGLSRFTTIGLISQVAGFGCLVVAYMKRHDVTVQGLYANRSVQKLGAGYVASTRWLLAAGILMVISAALFMVGARRAAN
jgi:hypothetical protein